MQECIKKKPTILQLPHKRLISSMYESMQSFKSVPVTNKKSLGTMPAALPQHGSGTCQFPS
jgi:hypothetical protein